VQTRSATSVLRRNAPPGIFVISTGLTQDSADFKLATVAMPLRAFLLFLRNAMSAARDERRSSSVRSQCPSGHFCYFYTSSQGRGQRQVTNSRNAPPGIFVISTHVIGALLAIGLAAWFLGLTSQCPSGHFCYFYVRPRLPHHVHQHDHVAMPLRAFLLFLL
jgi:hypothetical protein